MHTALGVTSRCCGRGRMREEDGGRRKFQVQNALRQGVELRALLQRKWRPDHLLLGRRNRKSTIDGFKLAVARYSSVELCWPSTLGRKSDAVQFDWRPERKSLGVAAGHLVSVVALGNKQTA